MLDETLTKQARAFGAREEAPTAVADIHRNASQASSQRWQNTSQGLTEINQRCQLQTLPGRSQLHLLQRFGKNVNGPSCREVGVQTAEENRLTSQTVIQFLSLDIG